MESDQQDSTEQTQKAPAPTSLIENNVKEAVKGKEQTANLCEDNKADCKSVQPFVVKIEKTKGWSRAEIISICAIVISSALFVMTLITFGKTKKAVEISEMALNNAVINDSIRNQPYLQVTNPTIKNLRPNEDLFITYVVKNYGQLPAFVSGMYTGITYSRDTDLDEWKKDPLSHVKFEDNNEISSVTVANDNNDTSILNIPIRLDAAQATAFVSGKMIGYLFGRMKYNSPTYTVPHEYKYVIALIYKLDKKTNRFDLTYRYLYNKSE